MEDKHIQTLASYVPGIIIRRIADDPRPIRQPTAERLAAAVLFADITNFTALADRLSQEGVVASEMLADLLNDCFGHLINIIQDHGGEVTKFAGDALIALWPVPGNIVRKGPEAQTALANRILSAAQCALAIQTKLENYLAPGEVNLSLQIGIGAGDIYSVHLGGVFGRWEFFLSGTPLAQMSLAKDRARPGNVVVSPEVWDIIGHSCIGDTVGNGFVHLKQVREQVMAQPLSLPNVAPEAKKSLEAYIPAAVLSRLESGQAEWLSEMRYVTVLFIQLPRYGTSIKHPYMRTLPEAQAVMEALQGALYRYAGSINKFNVDDKGITLIAALGLPPLTHSDDAARAVHAALEMQDALKKLGRKSAIGITTGWVFCGPIGNEQRREYTMVGQVVNMAARLMQVAEVELSSKGSRGEIICDQDTYQAIVEGASEGQSLAMNLTFRKSTNIGIKGKIEPVVAYRPRVVSSHVIQIPTKKPFTLNLIGRMKERTELDNYLYWLQDAQIQQSRMVIMEGEAGSGKSLILGDLAEKARNQRIQYYIGSGQALEPMTLYHAWRPVFRQLFGMESNWSSTKDSRSSVLQQLPPIRGERGFPAFAIQLSPLLNPILGLDFPENRTTSQMSPEVRIRTTRIFLLRLLQRTIIGMEGRRPQPTLLILENGQWLDEASWELALSLIKEVGPLLIVIGTRPICEQSIDRHILRLCRRLKSLDNVSWLRLAPFEFKELEEMLCAALGVASVPEPALIELFHRTGGNPRNSLEIARQWQHRGILSVEANQCVLSNFPEGVENHPIPLYIQQTITARLERLIPLQQLILKIASVLGTEFSFYELSNIFPFSSKEEDLLKEIRGLEESGFLRKVGSDSGPHYRFDSKLARDVAYSLLPISVRLRLESERNRSVK